jgi:ankyrin repeat protein
MTTLRIKSKRFSACLALAFSVLTAAIPADASPKLTPRQQAKANAALLAIYRRSMDDQVLTPSRALCLVKSVLVQGANVNAKDRHGETALMQASLWGHIDAVRLLVANGANVNAKDRVGMTTLMFAAYRHNTGCVTYLASHGADTRARRNDGRSVLMWACIANDPEAVRFLLSKGVDVNCTDKSGHAALQWAAYHPDVIDILKAHGAK